MIQRPQTLFMLLSAIMMALMIFFPLGYIVAGAQEFELLALGLKGTGAGIAMEGGTGMGASLSEMAANVNVSTWGLGIIVAVAGFLPLVTIFLFKNRLAQFRFCMAEFALLLGAQVIALITFYKFSTIFAEQFDLSAATLAMPMFFPAVAILFNWLALRGINKDILLVKSLERIR